MYFKWVTNAAGGSPALVTEGRTDPTGRMRFDRTPSFGASVVGTMLTMQVAPNGLRAACVRLLRPMAVDAPP
jgi:hypothetical protein